LLLYTVVSELFDKKIDLIPSQYTSSQWTISKDNTSHLRYDLFYHAKDQISGDNFINYHNRFELECIIENIEADANEIIRFKEIVNTSCQLFLMENSRGYYNHLNFYEMNYLDDVHLHKNPTRQEGIDLEVKALNRTLGI
jgi:hypothetical protein